MFLLILLVLGIFAFAIWKGRKNPKIAAFIFFGIGLISLIVGFKFKDWVWQSVSRMGEEDGAEETIKTFEPIIFICAFLFLILGGYFLYKSTQKKG